MKRNRIWWLKPEAAMEREDEWACNHLDPKSDTVNVKIACARELLMDLGQWFLIRFQVVCCGAFTFCVPKRHTQYLLPFLPSTCIWWSSTIWPTCVAIKWRAKITWEPILYGVCILGQERHESNYHANKQNNSQHCCKEEIQHTLTTQNSWIWFTVRDWGRRKKPCFQDRGDVL